MAKPFLHLSSVQTLASTFTTQYVQCYISTLHTAKVNQIQNCLKQTYNSLQVYVHKINNENETGQQRQLTSKRTIFFNDFVFIFYGKNYNDCF